MAILKCKMCGGDLVVEPNTTVCECEYCGSKQTIPTVDNEKKMTLFSRANRLLRSCEFDKAEGIFESIVAEFPEEAEAYWGLVLCKYGIEYVDDPATGKKVPTCHRSSYNSVLDDSDFEQVMENADSVARAVYREQAKQIEELRKGIIEVSGKEESYDIFICYKETDENKERTMDSVLAQDIYDALTSKGYRVFFSRISLEDKLGVEYEPFIFAALNSAKIMLAIGTSYDYYNAVWVKNEWSRYLKLMAADKGKYLIPCYKDIDAYDIPKEFAKLQAQDLGKVGAIQDLLRGIEKLIGPGNNVEQFKTSQTLVVQQNSGPSLEALIRRAYIFLEDKEWERADDYFEQALDLEPENAKAYLGKLMAELRISKSEQIADLNEFPDTNIYWKKTMRYADTNLKNQMEEYLQAIKERLCKGNLKALYETGLSLYKRAVDENDYLSVAEYMDNAGGYADSEKLAQICRDKAESLRKDAIYKKAKSQLEELDREEILKAIPLLESISGYLDADELIKHIEETVSNAQMEKKYQDASWLQLMGNKKDLKDAAEKFLSIAEWKDSATRADDCRKKLEELEKLEEQKRIRKENEEKKRIQLMEKKQQMEDLLKNLQKERASLGFFAMKRKQEIDSECAEILRQLENLKL